MKCIFCSMMFSNLEKDISYTKNPKSISGHKFQCNLIKGLVDNNVDLEVYNTQRIRVFPHDKKIIVKEKPIAILPQKEFVGIDIKYINIPILNYISQYISLKKKLREVIRRNKKEEIVFLIFNTHFIQTKAVFSIKRKYPSIITCNVVGDLYGKYGLKITSKGLQKVWQNYIEKQQELMQTKFDKYVLLAPMMQKAMKIPNKDFVVIEGFYNNCNIEQELNKNLFPDKNKKIIFYAGSLKLEYGLEHLLKAFELIELPNYYLFIAGLGDGDILVNEYAKKNNRINYFGFLSPQEVRLYQQMATVLVSPRKTDSEFVKYSFPSKTFECLASGKPYIAHKLPCEPEEYSEYIQYPENETDKALCEKIIQICEMSQEEREEIGRKAKDFIINKKNPKVMSKKIVDLLKSAF